MLPLATANIWSSLVPRSMTGFGSADGVVAGGVLQVDVKTVNHRHFSMQLKVPGTLQVFEAQIRETLRKHIDRGHATVVARWTEDASRSQALALDMDRARQAHKALKALKKELKLKDKISLDLIARQPDVMKSATIDEQTPEFDEIRKILEKALKELVAVRDKEGEQLTRELSGRFLGIATHLENVEAVAPERATKERERLRLAVAELVDGYSVAEDRIAQEIAFMADKMDVTEETVRLRTHLAAARDTLASDGPVGKKLTFLSQEILREINTIGSKANNADMAQDVIAMKGELEKVREQVENLE